MNEMLSQNIENAYGFKIISCMPAPRQTVAETYFLNTDTGERYFCKIIPDSIFIPRVIQSLPVLCAMHEHGVERVIYPIKTVAGELSIQYDSSLIILFPVIDATQSFAYDKRVLGRLTAEIHHVTQQIDTPIPKDTFTFAYRDDFNSMLDKSLHPESKESIIIQLQAVLEPLENEIKGDWERYMRLSDRVKEQKHAGVITHGDAIGNILVKTPHDIYIVDWDDLLWAPAERDVWFFNDDNAFLEGYREVIPDYTPHNDLLKFYLCSRYFEDMYLFMRDITGDNPQELKQTSFHYLKKDCFGDWLRPKIRTLDAS